MFKFGKTLYVDTPYVPEEGSFAKYHSLSEERYKIIQWYYCRELFHNHLKDVDLFFFAHKVGCANNVIKFMQRIEDITGCPKSNFGPTQRKNIIWIQPSIWWKKSIKKSLFTILLRCGNNYSVNRDNFEDALFSYAYASDTKHAINRFLNGFTLCLSHKRGWHKQFKNKSSVFVNKLLVKEEFNHERM